MIQDQSMSDSIIGEENDSGQYDQIDEEQEEAEEDFQEQENLSSTVEGRNKIEISTIILNPTQKDGGNQSLKISINLGGNNNNQHEQQQQQQLQQQQQNGNKLQNIQYMTSRQTRRTFSPDQPIFSGKVKQRPQRKNRQSDDENEAQRKLQKKNQNKKLMQAAKKAELKKILESISKKSVPKKARKQQTLKQKAQKNSLSLSSLHPLQKRINYQKHIISRQKNCIIFPVQLPSVLRQQQQPQRKGNLFGRVCNVCQKDAKYFHKEGFSSCSLKCYKELKSQL